MKNLNEKFPRSPQQKQGTRAFTHESTLPSITVPMFDFQVGRIHDFTNIANFSTRRRNQRVVPIRLRVTQVPPSLHDPGLEIVRLRYNPLPTTTHFMF